jgi:hypothetical protein
MKTSISKPLIVKSVDSNMCFIHVLMRFFWRPSGCQVEHETELDAMCTEPSSAPIINNPLYDTQTPLSNPFALPSTLWHYDNNLFEAEE